MQTKASQQPGKEELIGRRVTVESSTDPTLVGVTGEVLDETMKTLTVRNESGATVMIAKDTVTLAFELEGHRVEVDGRTLMFRPEDRIKKVRDTRTRKESR
jgi:ribonuclease P protein subunit POP4